MIHKQNIKEWGKELGFVLVGVAPAEESALGGKLEVYLEKGYQGEMGFLGRNVSKRCDPSLLVSGARSVICTALNYYSPLPEEQEQEGKRYGKVARYAWRRDYHEVIRERLERLAGRIREEAGGEITTRCFVDTAPLLEKSHAARAGLGWIGKNGLLLNEAYGSWLMLGEIVTDLELEYDQPVADQCGDCRACLEACPTGALVEPRILDARKCISYLTIENRRSIPPELTRKMGGWVFGCDVCQEACPYNQAPPITTLPEFQPRRPWCRIDLQEMMEMSEEQFQNHFAGSCILRAGREHLQHMARLCREHSG